ncbi:MAG TPA: hypothetical protein VG097_11745 [Gemmata sp.]|nr:hypothetical protein [Gemmata sp.]
MRLLIDVRLGVDNGTAGTGVVAGREAGTGTGPDFPGILSRASNSWCELVVQDVVVTDGVSVEKAAESRLSTSGVLAVAAMGGGVDASSRRRSSAAEIEGAGSG